MMEEANMSGVGGEWQMYTDDATHGYCSVPVPISSAWAIKKQTLNRAPTNATE